MATSRYCSQAYYDGLVHQHKLVLDRLVRLGGYIHDVTAIAKHNNSKYRTFCLNSVQNVYFPIPLVTANLEARVTKLTKRCQQLIALRLLSNIE